MGCLIACATQPKFSTLFMLVADVVTELILYTDDLILEMVHFFPFWVDDSITLYNVWQITS